MFYRHRGNTEVILNSLTKSKSSTNCRQYGHP